MAQIIMLTLQLSIVGAVLAIGLATQAGDLVSLLKRPGLLLKSLFTANVVMLLVAILIVRLMDLPHIAAVGLIAMSMAPMPPILPNSMIKAGGEASYARALLATMGLATVIWIPFVFAVIVPLFGIEAGVSPLATLKMTLITILAPLIAGGVIARLWPRFAAAVSKPLALISMLVLVAIVLLIIVKAWDAIVAHAEGGAVLAVVLFTVAALTLGHLMGGPVPGDRTVLALACAMRHPGILVVVVRMTAPNETGVGAFALLILLVSFACCLPYIVWRKKTQATGGAF